MNIHRITIGLLFLIVASSAGAAGKAIPADSTGLSKESVFNVPVQKVYQETGGQPGEHKVLPRAYLNAPPQVSHAIDEFLPITTETNLCVACHNLPDQWGKKRDKGVATPIPQSHYTDLRKAPDKVGDKVVGSRYNCNQCHVPQMNASPLVENTFSAGKKR